MMKNKKSGFAGKVKVALVLVSTIAFSATIIQCNSTVEEQATIHSAPTDIYDSGQEVHLPVLPDIAFKAYLPAKDVLNFTLTSNQLTIDGTPYAVDEIKRAIETSGLTEHGIVAMRIDGNQGMKMVREVQAELRKANRRKVLYVGQTAFGKTIESAMLLPPFPGDNRPGIPQLPKIDAEYAAEHDIDLLKIRLGANVGNAHQRQVYAFVIDQMQAGKSNYVVSAKFDDEDLYSSYLLNLLYIQEGFNQIYQERAQQLFGKDYFELDRKDPKEEEQYKAVRKGIPKAISIAENC